MATRKIAEQGPRRRAGKGRGAGAGAGAAKSAPAGAPPPEITATVHDGTVTMRGHEEILRRFDATTTPEERTRVDEIQLVRRNRLDLLLLLRTLLIGGAGGVGGMACATCTRRALTIALLSAMDAQRALYSVIARGDTALRAALVAAFDSTHDEQLDQLVAGWREAREAEGAPIYETCADEPTEESCDGDCEGCDCEAPEGTTTH